MLASSSTGFGSLTSLSARRSRNLRIALGNRQPSPRQNTQTTTRHAQARVQVVMAGYDGRLSAVGLRTCVDRLGSLSHLLGRARVLSSA
eukprot:scaffold4212_cov122-Isochrysis_galbana.AAC.12